MLAGSEAFTLAETHLPVDALVGDCVALWWAAPTSLPDLGPRRSSAEQAAAEARLASLVERIGAALEQPPRAPAAQSALQQRFTAEAGAVLLSALGLEPEAWSALQPSAFADAILSFARAARRFDPSLDVADIYQAGRNVLTANLLQRLLGLPVQLTPAIFGYSLLYPYSDNVLDDPGLTSAAKQAFDARFRRRLLGEALPSSAPRAAAIDRAIALIEDQYPRDAWPQVYASLLAIHRAQSLSVQLQQRGLSPFEHDVLGLTFAKGGASVLADACLAAGHLSPAAVRFAFRLGAFLQLADDLEDVGADRRAGRLTLFSLTAGRWPLDALINRTLHFGAAVLAELPVPAAVPQRFLQQGLIQALVQSAGQARPWLTGAYARQLEAHAAYRFRFVQRLGQRLGRTGQRAAGWLAALEPAPCPSWMGSVGLEVAVP